MTTVQVWLAVFEPAALVAVRVTVNAPAAAKEWVGFWIELVAVPSPKFQDQAVGLPVEASVKVTVCPIRGEAGLKVKAAVGMLAAVFTVMVWLTLIDPPPLEAVRPTLKVPAVE